MSIRKDSFIVIQGWMCTDLKLKGNDLLIYALIYGFSQDGASKFTGSISYIEETFNISKPTVLKSLNFLVENNFIKKSEKFINNIKYCEYEFSIETYENFISSSKETLPGGSKETLPGGSKETLPGVVKKLYRGSKETLPGGGKETLHNNISLKYKNNILDNDSQTDVSIFKISAGKFINELLKQGIRFSSSESNKIMNLAEELEIDPMRCYRLSSYLRGEKELKPTKRMFLQLGTWEKMKINDYNDKETKFQKSKEFKQTEYSDSDDSFLDEILYEGVSK